MIDRILASSRQELLDLSARNRLLNTPRGQSKARRIDVVDELADEVVRLLVQENKTLSFRPGTDGDDTEPETAEDETSLSQPDSDAASIGMPAERHTDTCLQTRLTSEGLQKRLLAMYYDARTFEEEQGVSILYLAVGFLKWFESPTSNKERFAPLLLIPVELERQTAASRFRVRVRDEDIATNLSLQAKLTADFGVTLPNVPDLEDHSPASYFDAVAQAVKVQPRWEVVRNDISLWFFSFAKFLMYRDLDPETWPKESPLGQQPLLRELLQDGIPHDSPICPEDGFVDDVLQPLDMIHVTDADSSQSLVIEEVRRGRHLVVQGPPGTGKSQTITNLIATAVKQGQRVLFVAEKMAALDVVKRRLEGVGLGPMCLELHSHKANKKTVLADLKRTLELSRPKTDGVTQQAEALQVVRDRLNAHAKLINTPLQPSQLTPYQILGELVRLYADEVVPGDFTLSDSMSWSRQQFQERQSVLQEMVRHLGDLGPPNEHPWRGIGLDGPLLPSDVKSLTSRLNTLVILMQEAINGAEQLMLLMKAKFGAEGLTLTVATSLELLIGKFVEAPPMDRKQIDHEVWINRSDGIDKVLGLGLSIVRGRNELAGKVADVAWKTNLSNIRQHLAGRSWFRWFRREFRDACAAFKGILSCDFPKTQAERLRILDTVLAVQRAECALSSDADQGQLGRDAFGTQWKGPKSDWDSLAAILNWDTDCRTAQLPKRYREVFGKIDDLASCRPLRELLHERVSAIKREWQEIIRLLKLNPATAFSQGELDSIPMPELLARAESWLTNTETLSKWIGYRLRRAQMIGKDLTSFADQLHEGRMTADAAIDQFRVTYHETLIRHVFAEHPGLASFDGSTFNQLVSEFRDLDRRRIELARQEVAAAHFAAIPQGDDGIGEIKNIWREIQKKKNHKPVRQLLSEAGRAVQAIKPVFMMSPISIAQFLEPGKLQFDLLVIDEASQVSPVDAMGAIARAKQLVVVGDQMQLPPTRFFSKMTADDELSDEDESWNAGDIESILGLCISQGVPQRMLRWHYRSRHDSLIAVSNREFYNDRLFVVPSPNTVSDDQGLRFQFVANGIFDRGGSATNRIEARIVANAVMKHARTTPDLSLGVGAFSVAQRDAILDELELLRREGSGSEDFFTTGRNEPFFVKNLENIQGDERDVILISVGYGKDSKGFLAMNFGPLSTDGGERRLNVLISRAKVRCEVFSSIKSDDIDLARAQSRGAAAFKTFLRYAETGELETPRPTGQSFDSDFEREVAKRLEEFGYSVDCQVGTAGFRIDLAIIDPKFPGRYLLGIECDGASYHSARSARDRDRLRQQVLEDRGWIIHRIWSTDWFHRPDEQFRKTLAAIEQAKVTSASPKQMPSREDARATIGDDLIQREQGQEKTANPEHEVTMLRPDEPFPKTSAVSNLNGPNKFPSVRLDEQLRTTLGQVVGTVLSNSAALEQAKVTLASPMGMPPSEGACGTNGADLIQREHLQEQNAQGNREMTIYYGGGKVFVDKLFSIARDLPYGWQHQIESVVKVILGVLELEGPIHRDEVARRVAILCGQERTGQRVVRMVEDALDVATARGDAVAEGDFFNAGSQSEIRIRNRGSVPFPNLRKPEYLPPAEVRAAVIRLVTEHVGPTRNEVITTTARLLLGFTKTSYRLRELIERELQQVIDSGLAIERDGRLYAV